MERLFALLVSDEITCHCCSSDCCAKQTCSRFLCHGHPQKLFVRTLRLCLQRGHTVLLNASQRCAWMPSGNFRYSWIIVIVSPSTAKECYGSLLWHWRHWALEPLKSTFCEIAPSRRFLSFDWRRVVSEDDITLGWMASLSGIYIYMHHVWCHILFDGCWEIILKLLVSLGCREMNL